MFTAFRYPLNLRLIGMVSAHLPVGSSFMLPVSMTLIPVSKISDLVERRVNAGGARWTVRHCTSDGAAWRSMAFPNTSNIRERIPLPTGAFSCPPVSSTALPRAKPSVGVSAIPCTLCASG